MRIYKIHMTFDGKYHDMYIIGVSLEGALARVRAFRSNAEILEIRRIDDDKDQVILAGD
jgi:hypothetical protein